MGALDYKLHSMVEDFPAMPEKQYQALLQDVDRNGIRTPLLAWQGAIVDGRHRLRAARELELGPDALPVDHLPDDMPEAAVETLVRGNNLARRHLTQGQRAMMAARLGKGGWGGNRRQVANLPLENKQRDRAAMFGVSARMVRAADYVLAADTALAARVFDGLTPLHQAEAGLRLEALALEIQAGAGPGAAIADCAARLAAIADDWGAAIDAALDQELAPEEHAAIGAEIAAMDNLAARIMALAGAGLNADAGWQR